MKKLFSCVLALCLTMSLSIPASALELADAKQLLDDYYIDSIPDQVMEMDSLKDILAALGDPYTTYLPEDEYQKFLSSVNGDSLVGIGATIQGTFDSGYQILSVLPNSPALDAGLKAGDIVTAVDGVPLTAASDVVSLIRGEEGSTVVLTVRHLENGQLEDFTLTRRTVEIPIVSYQMAGDAAVIICDSFGDSTVESITQAITELEDGASAYIMDLRSNPGGTTTASAGSAGLFLGSGLMSSFRNPNGKYTHLYTLPSTVDMTDKPLIVLTSPYSASGSELFAGAIRDYGAGIGLGQRSFGKGIAQYIFDQSNYPELFEGDAMKITVSRFFSPLGATNHVVGILPTLVISQENTAAAALLLTSPQPSRPDGNLKLEVAGQTFYINLSRARKAENLAAFTELLQALPPSADLSRGTSSGWQRTTPEALAQRFGLDFSPRTFSDVAGTKYEIAIDTLACYQLLSGYDDGTFRPEQAITRAEFCAMVAAALDLPESTAPASFADVSAGAWYAQPVAAMAQRGFVSGDDNNAFRPNDTITYEEMVAILDNVAAWACMDGYDYAQTPLSALEQQLYSQYSPWARHAARNLGQLNALVYGVDPQSTGTRQVAAAALYATLEGAHLLWD